MGLREDLRPISNCNAYWDEYLMPVKPNGHRQWGGAGGGDVLHRCGLQAIEWWLKTQTNPRLRKLSKLAYQQQMQVLSCGEGNYKRYWKAVDFYGEMIDWFTRCCVMSRDQMIPNIIAWGLYGMLDRIEEFEKGLKDRSGFYTNTIHNGFPHNTKVADLATPQIYGMLDKAKGYRYITPAIVYGDAAELIDTYLNRKPRIKIFGRTYFPFGPQQLQEDPINKTMIFLFNKIVRVETDQAREARILYGRDCRVWESWERYWVRMNADRTENLDPQCPFHEVFEPYIKNLDKDYL